MSLLHFEPIAALWLIGLPWWGKAVVVIQERSGAAYVPLDRLYELACVRPRSPSNQRRALAHPHLSTALHVFAVFTDAPQWCLRVEAVQAWLVTVPLRSLRPELRPAVQELRRRFHAPAPLVMPPPIPVMAASIAGAALWALDERLCQLAQRYQITTIRCESQVCR